MAATFDPALPTARDRVRQRLGDSNTEYPLLPDATYDGAITAYGENGAASFLAASLVAEYGQLPVRVDENGVTLDYSERLRAWQWVVTQAASAPPTPVVVTSAAAVTLARRSTTAADEYGRPTRYWP